MKIEGQKVAFKKGGEKRWQQAFGGTKPPQAILEDGHKTAVLT